MVLWFCLIRVLESIRILSSREAMGFAVAGGWGNDGFGVTTFSAGVASGKYGCYSITCDKRNLTSVPTRQVSFCFRFISMLKYHFVHRKCNLDTKTGVLSSQVLLYIYIYIRQSGMGAPGRTSLPIRTYFHSVHLLFQQ